MRALGCWCLVVSLVASSAACASRKDAAPSPAAGAMTPADEAPPASEPPAADLEAEAEEQAREGDQDRAEPRAQPGGPSSGDSAAGPPLTDDASSASRRELDTLGKAQAAFAQDEQRLTQLLGGRATTLDTGTCGRVCDALDSMRRSADAICDLAGENDRRCDEARGKLQSSEDRVAGRGCRCS